MAVKEIAASWGCRQNACPSRESAGKIRRQQWSLNWRIACLTVGNEHFFRLITVAARFFYFPPPRILNVEHQPASGRAPGAGAAVFPSWPAPDLYAAMSARLLASIAGRGKRLLCTVGAGSAGLIICRF